MNFYEYKITKIYDYYGYPQARRTYKVETEYYNVVIEYYGNQGFDVPQIEVKHKGNGYFWSVNKFMKDYYSKNSIIQNICRELKLNESKTIKLGE